MSQSKLKIGFVVDDTLDKPDGVQQYVLLLGQWLSEKGHEVHYLVGQSGRKDIANVHSLSRNISVKFNKNRLSIPLPANRRQIKKLLNSEQFDVLHVQMPYSPFLAGRIVKLAPKSTAIVGTFHILPFSSLERVATRLLGMILRKNLKKFDQVIAVSEPAKQFALSSLKVEASVLPNVVNVASFDQKLDKNAAQSGTTNIVFLGRLVERKGALLLLRAVAALPRDLQNQLHVYIGGKGSLLPDLQKYTSDASLSDKVTFSGFITEEDKPKFLHQADIAVFPSTGGESFGIVLIEAIAAKSGVVLGGNNQGYSSVLAAWPETLFDPNNTAEFSSVLQKFITNENKRRTLHLLQQKALRQYDVANVGPKLIDIYEKIIAKHSVKQDNRDK